MIPNTQRDDRRAKKQGKILLILVIILSSIVFSPTIMLAMRGLFMREPIRFGSVDLVTPKDWMISRTTNKLKVWKPCSTIFCGSGPRPSFTIETSEIPEDVWERAAKKVFETDYSGGTTSRTIYGQQTPIKCVEINKPASNGWAVSSCVSSAAGLAATFAGDEPLKEVYYRVLLSAQKPI